MADFKTASLSGDRSDVRKLTISWIIRYRFIMLNDIDTKKKKRIVVHYFFALQLIATEKRTITKCISLSDILCAADIRTKGDL